MGHRGCCLRSQIIFGFNRLSAVAPPPRPVPPRIHVRVLCRSWPCVRPVMRHHENSSKLKTCTKSLRLDPRHGSDRRLTGPLVITPNRQKYIALFLRHRQQEKVFGGRKTGVLAEVNGFTGAFDCSNSAPTAPKKIGAFLALRSSFMRKSTLQNCGLCNSQFSATQPPNESYLCLTRTRDVPGFSLARVVCMAPAGLK